MAMLNPGTRIGAFEITGTLGAGGMGEVYRARDTRLRRDVALKVLPDMFARDPDRMVRFEREAQVLASLNHPHIAAIYGVEDTAAARALVMELVEGPRLPNGSHGARFHWKKGCRSRGRLRRHLKPLTNAASFTAT